jgi:N-acetylglutamate synthase-like GNAT family acetyltransferase
MDNRRKANTPHPRIDQGPLPSGKLIECTQQLDIRIAKSKDIHFIESLQKRYRGCLGFLTPEAQRMYIDRQQVQVAFENDQEAGYLLGSDRLRWQPLIRPIFQAAVSFDATRRHIGSGLLDIVISKAIHAGQIAIQANCAAELEANEFWKANGFKPICYMIPNTKTGREIICWRKPLTTRLPIWFAMPPQRAGHLAKNVTNYGK